ncbi:39S ribosomal protein L47, mitochondrial [Polypterus senegalus]|uniref:39S ribosomal protein L47, mitochondrial n=1 Tax=Polypterus senegalus TaxID=55291 RepID=UPI001964CD78|nr:39S ribosomal protein L47, mitochondrial [Polypterus senegalus]
MSFTNMAATSVGLVAVLCRNFQKGLTLCNTTCSNQSNFFHRTQLRFFLPRVSASNSFPSLVEQCRALHSSHSRRGLEEFFDDPKNWGEQQVKSGAPWTAKQLRTKSNEDLHKLWYVLLKEKNMLLTLEQESKRQAVPMPSPERLKKVERSMKRLDSVVNERTEALRLLQTGVQNERPGEWRKNCLGQAIWYKFKEHPIPWYMNRRYKKKQFFALPFVNFFTRLNLEKNIRIRNRKRRAEKEEKLKITGEVF